MPAKSQQRAPKAHQKAPYRHQLRDYIMFRGTKMVPKSDQNASQNRSSEKVAKKEPKWLYRLMLFGSVLESFSIKNR